MSAQEFAIIKRFFMPLAKLSLSGNDVIIGPGDDCAVLRVPENRELCVSTDTLVEGVHFLPNCDANVVAHRTMGANLSDLAAMGATPFAFLLAMTLPGVKNDWLERFSNALSGIIKKHHIPLVGGNLSKGTLRSLTVTVMGTVPIGGATKRTGASVDDDIYVTGTLGDAAQGLALARTGEEAGYLVDRYEFPEPRIEAGRLLRGLATSSIDISDGLVSEISHLTEVSTLGADIQASSIPLSRDLVKSVGQTVARRLALFSGDDYELCFTAKENDLEAIKAVSRQIRLPMTRIGKINGNGQIGVHDEHGELIDLPVSGYEHF
jgi:thiamine-monophosphate kinase